MNFTLEQVVLLIILAFIIANIAPRRLPKWKMPATKKKESKPRRITIDGVTYEAVKKEEKKEAKRGIYRYL